MAELDEDRDRYRPAVPPRAACAYTGCSCEEKAWKLRDCIRSRGERPVEESYAGFISDERRMAAFAQDIKATAEPEKQQKETAQAAMPEESPALSSRSPKDKDALRGTKGASERKRRRNNCARAAAKRRRSSFQRSATKLFAKENRVPTGDQNDSAEDEFVEKHVSAICQVKLNTEKESAKLCGYLTPRWGTITNENPSSNDSWAFQAVTPERFWEEDQQQIRDENTVKVPTETDYVVIVDLNELKITKGLDMYHLEKVYGVIIQCIYNHREDYDKTDLVELRQTNLSSSECTVQVSQERALLYGEREN